MKLAYKITIDKPEHHLIKVQIKAETQKRSSMTFFMPSWSPGSYLMREYARHIRVFMATNEKGERLDAEQISKSEWRVDFKGAASVEVFYELYAHDVSVRTPYVDISHAFLHLPAILMGVKGEKMINPTLQLSFPPIWSHVSTGLKEISQKREEFIYTAPDYDDLIDSPIEIGCHEVDGFHFEGKDHDLAFYGHTLPHKQKLKEDIETIVKEVVATMGEIPYEKYTFITHFLPNQFGGLEHKNSTVLMYDGAKIGNRKEYMNWLSLVAHEYFHTWNVKRIRPFELGPFDYLKEAYTPLLWLAEGLTSFMDELFIYRAGLITLEEYLEMLTKNLDKYLTTPGRRFHSLSESSFNAWIKLYRPDENTNNSSISYYLKGGVVFMILHALLLEKGKRIDDLLHKLWISYKSNPEVGLLPGDVFKMVEELGGALIREKFEEMVLTTKELDLEKSINLMGLSLNYEQDKKVSFGMTPDFKMGRLFVKSVDLDGSFFKGGINAGDEILAINNLRVSQENFSDLCANLLPDQNYRLLIARQGIVQEITLLLTTGNPKLVGIKILDKERAERSLKR